MDNAFRDQVHVISFDCYGTLIDWRSGVLNTLRPLLDAYHLVLDDEQIFALFFEADQKTKAMPYMSYREVLREQMKIIAKSLYLNLHPDDLDCLARSLPIWQPFPDTISVLKKLNGKYRLAILSNIDDDLFFKTNEALQVSFDWIITAQQLRSYKPAPAHFEKALQTFGLPKKQWLHVAQSIFHDIMPCRELGIQTAWINRYNDPYPADVLNSAHPVFSDLISLSDFLLSNE